MIPCKTMSSFVHCGAEAANVLTEAANDDAMSPLARCGAEAANALAENCK